MGSLIGSPWYIEEQHNVRFQCRYQFVFKVKRGKPVLVGDVAQFAQLCFEATAEDKGWILESCQIEPEHVNLIVEVSPSDSPNQVIKALKSVSSSMLRSEFPQLLKLPSLWSHSYLVTTAAGHWLNKATIREYLGLK